MFSRLAVLVLVVSCSPRAGLGLDPSRTEEAWDAHNAPSLMGLNALRYEDLIAAGATQGQFARMPWADTYWPYYEKDMAWRYVSGKTFTSVDDQIKDAKAHPDDTTLSPAEKYDLAFGGGDFPLTQNSWAAFSSDEKQYGTDTTTWDWMGICDGWAPAALAVPAPEHAVSVKVGGKPIVFFEGDLRGLSSKAYDLNATQDGYRSIGSRCNETSDVVPRDASGRPVDGEETDTDQTFAILQDDSLTLGAIEVTHDPLNPQPYWLVATQPIQVLDGKMDLYRYQDIADVTQDVLAQSVGTHADNPKPVPVELFKACRATNPASLHLALVQLLGNATPAAQRSSFVADISRYNQIWNQPVWGYDTQISRPLPIADEAPAQRVFRAPGAAFSASVDTKLVYVAEVTPQVAYPSDATTTINFAEVDAGQGGYSVLDLQYTLEFDADGYVVGAEWVESPTTDINVVSFLWQKQGEPTDAEPDGSASPLKYSALKKLLDCSHGTPTTSTTVDQGGQHLDVQVVDCQI